MKILQLSPQIPFPLSDGGKVGIFNITKHLALRGHSITLLAFERELGVDIRQLQEFCTLIKVPHSNKNSLLGAFVNIFDDIPYNMSKYRSRAYERSLVALLRSKEFDVVHVDHLHMAHYGLLCRKLAGTPIVLREHNVESVILERYAASARSPFLRPWLAMQQERLRKYEAEHAAKFDLCCVITEEDRSRLAELSPQAKLMVVPAGVDLMFFEEQDPTNQVSCSVSMFGSFDWIPNQDALQWFVDEVFPRVLSRRAEAKLFLIGKAIPHRYHRSAGDRIVVRGFAQNLKEELRRYQVTVVPLRIGGGMRLKVLESFAMRVPVVSTTIGSEGIAARDGEHLLIADTEEQFADRVVRLLDDRDLRSQLAHKAHILAQQMYRWERIAEQLETAYADAIRARKEAAQ